MAKSEKEEDIKKLNQETLFQLRKQYGMYTQINFLVVDIEGDTLVVEVSTDRDGLGLVRAYGTHVPTLEQSKRNIKVAVEKSYEHVVIKSVT